MKLQAPLPITRSTGTPYGNVSFTDGVAEVTKEQAKYFTSLGKGHRILDDSLENEEPVTQPVTLADTPEPQSTSEDDETPATDAGENESPEVVEELKFPDMSANLAAIDKYAKAHGIDEWPEELTTKRGRLMYLQDKLKK